MPGDPKQPSWRGFGAQERVTLTEDNEDAQQEQYGSQSHAHRLHSVIVWGRHCRSSEWEGGAPQLRPPRPRSLGLSSRLQAPPMGSYEDQRHGPRTPSAPLRPLPTTLLWVLRP